MAFLYNFFGSILSIMAIETGDFTAEMKLK